MELFMGCVSKPFCEQLDAQDIKYDKQKMQQFQEAQKLLCILKFCRLFTNSQINSAYDKLFRQVEKHLKKCIDKGDNPQ